MLIKTCIFLACRKALLPYSDTIKRKLKMTSEDSFGKFRRTFTVSYSVRKRKLLVPVDPSVTETVVGLDDTYTAEDEAPDAVSAEETTGANTTGHLEIHTS